MIPRTLLFALSLVLALPVSAQPVSFDKIGHWTDGPARAVAADGSTVYLGGSADLQIADFSDPSNPQVLGNLDLGGVINAIELADDHAYAAQQNGVLAVVNVSDPVNPSRVSTTGLSGTLDDVTVAGGTAYVLESSGFGRNLTLYAYDATDPADLSMQGSIDVGRRGESTTPSRIAVADGYVYAGADEGMRIIDVSDPTSPSEAGRFELAGYSAKVGGVDVRGDYAYANGLDSLRVIDVSDPTAPVQVGIAEASTGATAVAVQDDYAYVTDRFREKGLHVMDISDPANPSGVGQLEVGGFSGSPEVLDAAVVGGRAYLAADYEGVLAVDVSEPSNPSQDGALFTGGDAVNLAVSGDYVYAVQSTDASVNSGQEPAEKTLWVADVSDPADPQTVGTLQMDGENEGIAVRESLVFMARGTEGFQVVDAADPTSPTVVGTIDRHASAVVASETYVYTLNRPYGENDGFAIVDASDPADPAEVGYYEAPDRELYDLIVRGEHAYIATLNPDGLLTLDLSDPTAPAEVGFTELHESGPLAVGGGYAYVTPVDLFAEDSLRIVDVSDPASPILFNTAELDDINSPNGMTYVDGFLFADGGSAVNAYDVTDPANPVEADSYTDLNAVERVAFADGRLYVAAAEAGFVILNVETMDISAEPAPTPDAGIHLTSPAPNPFIAEAQFALSVPQSQRVSVALYDVLGRRVATLHDGLLAAGTSHRFTLNGDRLPAGVYFVRAVGEAFTATQSAVRVR